MLFEQVNSIIAEIEQASPATPEALEQFRIRFLGSKNVIKALSGEIRNIPNEQKRDFGRLINEAIAAAEAKFQSSNPIWKLPPSKAAPPRSISAHPANLEFGAPGIPFPLP